MGIMTNLKRQHSEISEVVKALEGFTKKGSIEEDAGEIAKNINVLAGKLKIHLDTEDKFLYPRLLREGNNYLQIITKEYNDEMGHISGEFMKFKDKFNTKNKILNNLNGFSQELRVTLNILIQRMNREDRDLYPLIED